VTFREDGYAAVDWAADYLDRIGDLPVLAQVAPGELQSRLPARLPRKASLSRTCCAISMT